MSRKAWWLRHGFRRLKIRNWRESAHSLKHSGELTFSALGSASCKGGPAARAFAQNPSIKLGEKPNDNSSFDLTTSLISRPRNVRSICRRARPRGGRLECAGIGRDHRDRRKAVRKSAR